MDLIHAALAAAQATPHVAPPNWWAPHAAQTVGTLAATGAGVWIGAWLVTRREAGVREEKRAADALYLAITVSGMLEQFSAACLQVSFDDGRRPDEPFDDYPRSVQVEAPSLTYAGLDVEWKSLPGVILDQVHSVPRKLANLNEYAQRLDDHAGEDYYFSERQRLFAQLGVHAATVSAELRITVGLSPSIDQAGDTLKQLIERHSKLEALEAERRARQDEWLSGLFKTADG